MSSRHNDAVVVFDRTSQRLQLENVDQTNDVDLQFPSFCPYCHRPMPSDGDNESDIGDDLHGRSTPTGYVDPNYFSMLHSNQLASAPRRVAPASTGNRLGPYVVDERDEESATATGTATTSTGHLASAGISPESFNDGFFQRNFIEERMLGKGGKGVVILVKHMLGNNDLGLFACKRIPVGDSPEWLRKVLIEVQTLKTLSHQNLAPYHHAWLEHSKISSFGPTVPCVFILQKYCEAGDLHKYVCGSVQTELSPQQLKARMRRRSRGEPDPATDIAGPRKLQIEMIYSFFKDINSGLRYLHKKGLIHRDLKPSNCLLTMEGSKLRAVVSDFGEVQSEDMIRSSTGSTGTVSYCAPEVLQRVSSDGPFGNFSYKSDIFSLGMILYFLCFATLPYVHADVINEDNEDLDMLRDEISQWPGFDDVQRSRPELPDQVYWLLARLLALDPNKRPSAKEIFDFMKNRHNADFSSHDRRPSLHASRELPGTSPAPSDQIAVHPQDSVSPNLQGGRASKSPELGPLASNGAATGRDYGTVKADSGGPFKAQGSLVLSRKPGPSQGGYHQESPLDYDRVRSNERRERSYERAREYGRGHPPDHQHDERYFLGGRDRGRSGFTRTSTSDSVEVDPGHSHRRYSSSRSPSPGSHENPDFMNFRLPFPPARRTLFTRRILSFPFTQTCLHMFCAHPMIADMVSFAVFLLKIVTITIPCSPQAPLPIIFYPLLVLATVDFGMTSGLFHVFALACHVLTVISANGLDSMCAVFP